jgi:hypothetical protein
MYPNPINRALCSAGMTAGGSRTAHVLPTVRREANSSGVRGADSDAIIRLCPSACIGTWSTLLRWANKAASVGGPRWRALTNHPPRGHASAATWRVRAIAPVAADCHVKRGPVHTAAGREYDDGGSWSGSPLSLQWVPSLSGPVSCIHRGSRPRPDAICRARDELWRHPNVQNETIAIFWRRNLDTVLIREHYNRTLPEGDSLCVRLVKR